MKLCSLSGVAARITGAGAGSEHEPKLLCPLVLLGMGPVEGAVCGAFGIKSSRILSGCLMEVGILAPLAPNREFFECRFEVPRDENEARLYKDELNGTTMINMLRLRTDALDFINERWISYFDGSPPGEESYFPRSPTSYPHLIERLRTEEFPGAKLIIFPIKALSEVIAIGAYFEPSEVRNIVITM